MGGRVGGEVSKHREHLRKALWGGHVWPLGIEEAGVAQDEGWRGKQVPPLGGLPFGLPQLWKASVHLRSLLGSFHNPCKCPQPRASPRLSGKPSSPRDYLPLSSPVRVTCQGE